MIDPETLRGDWSYPTAIRFGPGRIGELADACRSLGMARPLLVTDPGLAALPMVQSALDANAAAGLPTALFADIQGNPLDRNVADGVAAYRTGGQDGVIAFGGGSAVDAAKTIALMVVQDRPLWDFEDKGDNWKRIKVDRVVPVVAVPTTAGTGSEVGRASVIVDTATTTKKVIFHPCMMPAIVIADPELTLGLPPAITAATGMDALAHSIEAFCAPAFHPMADGIALEGLRLVQDWLPAAYANGANLAARAHMLVAASMGATAFQKGLGAVHAISHPISAHHGVHHGLANAILLPYVLKFNRPAIEDKMVRLGQHLGLGNPTFDGVQAWLLELRHELEIPHCFGDIGVTGDDADQVAETALQDPTAVTNPVPLDSAMLKRIFLDCVEGIL